MGQVLFTLLAMFSGASVGAALFASWCLWKLRKLSVGKERRFYAYLVAVKIGLSGTFGTLLAIIVPRATIAPSIASWTYISFLALAAYGLVGIAGSVSDRLAELESVEDEGLRQDVRDVKAEVDRLENEKEDNDTTSN